MEGFTLSLALVDAIPVLLFGGSMLLVAAKFQHPLFLLGALLSTLAGCCKVAWKLVLGIWKKDIRWLNKPFVPMQATGFLLMLLSLILSLGKLDLSALLSAVTGFPTCLFLIAWAALMGFMGWFRKNKFGRNDAKSNWTAQIVNALGQGCLFLAVLFAQ